MGWQRAVVTGAGSGIGRALSRELARRGAHVVCADVDMRTATTTATEIEAAGGRATAVGCDVTSLDEVEALADAAEAAHGGPADLVVNNAGVATGGAPIGDLPIEDWQWTLGVNLWGVIHGCHVFVPRLREAGRGGIVNVASSAAFAAGPGMGPYGVSKAGVLALSETLAAEVAADGLAVSVLCPTFVRTRIVDHARVDARTRRAGELGMRWTGRSADRVARQLLDAHADGDLYVVPQVEGKLLWALKRHFPRLYLRMTTAGARRMAG